MSTLPEDCVGIITWMYYWKYSQAIYLVRVMHPPITFLYNIIFNHLGYILPKVYMPVAEGGMGRGEGWPW